MALSATSLMTFSRTTCSLTWSAGRYFFTISRSMPYCSAIFFVSASISSSVASMPSALMSASMARSMRTCCCAGSFASALTASSVLWTIFRYWSKGIPWDASCCFRLSTIFSHCRSIIASGMSASMPSATFCIRASSKARWAAFSRSSVIFFFRSAFSSLSVSNSETSLANSSSMAGTSLALTSLTFTWKTTGLPASSGV